MTEQLFCEALEISLRVINYLEVITFLGVTNSSEVTFLLQVTISLVEVVCYVGSIYGKDTDTEGTSIKSSCIRGVYARVASLEGTCAGVEGSCISGTCTKNICIEVASDEGTCVGSIWAVKCLRIYLQSFQNLELGSTRLEIRVRTGCTCIESTCVGRNLELGGAKLRIWIGTGW